MQAMLDDIRFEYRRHRKLAESALASLDEAAFFRRPAEHVNSPAVIVKHLAGNFRSRWTNFLTSDGEKPDRDRDSEFRITAADSRESLMESWRQGWESFEEMIQSLTPADLGRSVAIRGELHSVAQALLRGLAHTAWHAGQILYLSRLYEPTSPWLTVEPGKSAAPVGAYRKRD